MNRESAEAAMGEPMTQAGRSLVRQWKDHPNEPEVRIVVTAIEDQARAIEALHHHRFDVVIRDDSFMRLLGCSGQLDGNQCPEVYQWDW